MMTLWKALVGIALLLFEHIRGPKRVLEICSPDQALGSLQGFTIRGYQIEIHCHRKEYHVKYERWYIPNRILRTYKVFSTVGSEAPAALRKACELDVDLPPLVRHCNFDDVVKHVQVLAYLDLLERRMVEYSNDET